MSLFEIIGIKETQPESTSVKSVRKPRQSKPKIEQRGCEFCPLNLPDNRKMMGKMTGKDILVIVPSPNAEENQSGEMMSGSMANLIWQALKKVGITRKDCDIQYTVRCFPSKEEESQWGKTYLKMRPPTAKEMKCCSIHTDTAMEKSKAKQILVFGAVAAKAFLKKRSVPSVKEFYSEEYKAKIYLLDNPAIFFHTTSKDQIKVFQDRIKQVAKDRGKDHTQESTDPYHFIKSQDYKTITDVESAKLAIKEIREIAGKNRISVDIENDVVDGRDVMVCIGISPKPGISRCFITEHPSIKPSTGRVILKLVKKLLEDPSIRKCFQYGCTDVRKLKVMSDIRVQGYDHDTFLSEWMRNSNIQNKSYGLDSTAANRFPKFTNYKYIIAEYLGNLIPELQGKPPEFQYKNLSKYDGFHMYKLPLDILTWYNGADCDLTKQIEITNKKVAPQALMNLYIDLSFILMDMEPNGPDFDYEQSEKLRIHFDYVIASTYAKMKEIVGRDFNPNSPPVVYDILYNQLALEYPFDGKPNTRALALAAMGSQHEFPVLLRTNRKANKSRNTYAVGYRECADAHDGKLRTIWWATGTATGRLSSGKGKDKTKKLVNLQNVQKLNYIKNMCVADARWRKVYRAFVKIAKEWVTNKIKTSTLGQLFEAWIRKHMPDLKCFQMLDYGQIEVRVVAQLSQDKQLLNDCASSDIHTAVGVTMTGWTPEEIKNDEFIRTLTKNTHFGIIFGQTEDNTVKYVCSITPEEQIGKAAKKLRSTMKRYRSTHLTDLEIFQDMIRRGYRRYKEKYVRMGEFADECRAFTREHGYTETLFGLRRMLDVNANYNRSDEDEDEFFDDDDIADKRKGHWTTQALNTKVQGSAHQLVICGLVNLLRNPEKYKVLGIPVQEVHDSITFRYNVLDLKEAVPLAKNLLEKDALEVVKSDFPKIKWEVPIIAESKVGLRSGDGVKVEDNTTIAQFLEAWYHKAREQEIEFNKLVKEAQEKMPVLLAQQEESKRLVEEEKEKEKQEFKRLLEMKRQLKQQNLEEPEDDDYEDTDDEEETIHLEVKVKRAK